MQVEKTKTQSNYLHNPDRELSFEEDKIFFKGIDVTSISERQGKDFVSVMGSAGGKSFHNYFGKDKNDKWYKFTGVTSALDYVGDKSNLMQWYANQVVEQFGWSKQLSDENAATYKLRLFKDISFKILEFIALTIEEKVTFILKARTAASQYTKKTANLGKDVHSDIEAYIKECIKLHKGVAVLDALGGPIHKEQVQHFIDWALKNKVVFKASEHKVHSKKHWYAGTLDIVLEINGDLYLGDIKTTNSIWGRSYFAQCAAYRQALEESYPGRYNFAGSIIVRIGRDGLFNPDEDVHFSPYYEDDLKYFMAGLEIYRQENNQYQR